MHMWAMDNITTRSKISVNIANLLIDICFNSIDQVLNGNCPSLATDAAFVAISNMSCASFCEELETCKQRVRQHKAAKRRKGKGPENETTLAVMKSKRTKPKWRYPCLSHPL